MDGPLHPVEGVMWCSTHHGIADECNDGARCDMADEGTECDLRDLFYRGLIGGGAS
jgi:hypothetical protein